MSTFVQTRFGRDTVPAVVSAWNLDFSPAAYRRKNMRRLLRQLSESRPKGNGNKAWKRLDNMTSGDFHLTGNIYLTTSRHD